MRMDEVILVEGLPGDPHWEEIDRRPRVAHRNTATHGPPVVGDRIGGAIQRIDSDVVAVTDESRGQQMYLTGNSTGVVGARERPRDHRDPDHRLPTMARRARLSSPDSAGSR